MRFFQKKIYKVDKFSINRINFLLFSSPKDYYLLKDNIRF